MLVMRHNEHQIENFEILAEELGLNQYNKGKIEVNPNVSVEWLPTLEEYR